MELKSIIPYVEDDDEPRLAEHALWCSVIERLVYDLRAPINHPLRIRQKAIRDFLLNEDHIREILEDRCGFPQSVADGFFEKLVKLVKRSEAELTNGAAAKVPERFWWAKRLLQ